LGRISIDEIRNSVTANGWELISDVYYNLDSNLEFRCDKGHPVIAPWKRLRENLICPTCMRERLKTKEFHNTKKKKGEFRILALD